MAELKQVAVAADGTVFETLEDAQAHDALGANKERIEAFVDRYFPIPAPELVFNEDGSPKLNEKGEQEKKAKQNAGRGPARKAISLWISENQ